MAFLIGFFNALAILVFIYYWYKHLPNSPIKAFFIPALALKLGAGLLMGILYQWHYTGGDTLSYFQDAQILANLAYQSPAAYWEALTGSAPVNLQYADQPRALAIVKLISIPAIISYNNYWISSIYFSLISFIGMWKLCSLLAALQPNFKYAAVIAFLFYPSVVFWSSGLLKEPLVMACLAICLVIYLRYIVENRSVPLKNILLSLLLMYIIWQLKFYYAAVFVPLLVVCVGVTFLKNLSPWFRNSLIMQLLVTILLPLVIYFPLSLLNPILNFQNLFAEIIRNHDWYLINGVLPQEGYIHFSTLKPEITSFIGNAPLALFSGLFRPLAFDATNLLQFIAGVENTTLLILFIAALPTVNRIRNSRFAYLFFITVLYIVILAIFLAFAAPNFGTLMRYKTAFLPFLVFLVLADNPLVYYLKNKIAGGNKK